MSKIYFRSVPFVKEHVTLALESGVDGIITTADTVVQVNSLARCTVLSVDEIPSVVLQEKSDEEALVQYLNAGRMASLARGWEIIPVENLLAQCEHVAVEVGSLEEARLAAGILEKGVEMLVVMPEAVMQLKDIVAQCKTVQQEAHLQRAVITRVEPVGLGHRVCVDTVSMLERGQGMLVGNSSAFCFLVHAETEHNEYVAARPFRINAGAVHAYVQLPDDRTCYLEELRAGQEVLIVDAQGKTIVTTVGRIKLEVRPMLFIEAIVGDHSGAVFLQNAETIRLMRPDGMSISVVNLKPGDEVLCSLDTAGRHFGMRVPESIREG